MLLLDPFLLFIFVSKMSNIHSNVDKTSLTKIIGLYLTYPSQEKNIRLFKKT